MTARRLADGHQDHAPHYAVGRLPAAPLDDPPRPDSAGSTRTRDDGHQAEEYDADARQLNPRAPGDRADSATTRAG